MAKREFEQEKKDLIDEFLTSELSLPNFARYKEIEIKNLRKRFSYGNYKTEQLKRVIKHYDGQKVFRKVNFTGIKETSEEKYIRKMTEDNKIIGKKTKKTFMNCVKQVSKKQYRLLYKKFCIEPKNEILSTFIKTLNPD